jgi:hypothetical protein
MTRPFWRTDAKPLNARARYYYLRRFRRLIKRPDEAIKAQVTPPDARIAAHEVHSEHRNGVWREYATYLKAVAFWRRTAVALPASPQRDYAILLARYHLNAAIELRKLMTDNDINMRTELQAAIEHALWSYAQTKELYANGAASYYEVERSALNVAGLLLTARKDYRLTIRLESAVDDR